MTIQVQVPAFGALLLFQSEIEVNRPAVREMSTLDFDFHTRIVRQQPRESASTADIIYKGRSQLHDFLAVDELAQRSSERERSGCVE
jgi:hypothetical protein